MLIITFIFVALIVTGVTLNSLTIWISVKHRFLLSPPDLPVLSVATANCILITLTMPFGAAGNARSSWPFGSNGCTWYACLNAIIGLGTIPCKKATGILAGSWRYPTWIPTGSCRDFGHRDFRSPP